MTSTFLTTTNLTKTYKNVNAIDNLSITINKGDIYGFIGQNGAGKTTFLRTLTGLITQTSGSINCQANRIGAVIEGPTCYPYLSAEDNLHYYAIQQQIKDTTRIKEVLNFVGLAAAGKKPFKDFSLGMKQRLGIAVSLLTNPDLLILDEPINGLDPQGIIEIRQIIQRLNSELGTTILISSHILTELALVATRYGFIDKGKLIKELTKEELAAQCQHELALSSSDNQKAFAILSQAGYTPKQSTEQTLTLVEEPTQMPEIARLLFQEGLYLSHFSHQQEDLESYFLTLITGGNKHV